MRTRSIETVLLMGALAGAAEISVAPRPIRETSLAVVSSDEATRRFIRTAVRHTVDARRRGQVSGR
ncbi:hypothetical protein KBB08_03795 [Candidatus Gracilibacteria bacterium]|nr:hypothetical protein [Candidatus Gracilibacteria bacterium]